MPSLNIKLEKTVDLTFLQIKSTLINSVFFSNGNNNDELLYSHTCAKCLKPIMSDSEQLEVIDSDDISTKKMYFHMHHFS